MSMRYQVAQFSLRGARKTNEDRAAYVERKDAVLMILADGLGGHVGGALAAEILVRVATRAFQRIKQPVIIKPSAFLALTMIQAHKLMRAHGQAQVPPIAPRTTCVLCLVQNGYAYWAHVGDSRLYHFRDNRVKQRTLDDTSTEQLRADGLLTEDEMATHPEKSRLLKCLGGDRRPGITLGKETALHHGDLLLLCSDGLWEALKPPEILPYLQVKSLEEGVEDMLHDAEDRMRQASDNVSAVCLRWEQGVTTSPPLQARAAAQVNQDQLWFETRKQTTAQPPRKLAPQDAKDPKQSIEATIAEIEGILKHLDTKS